MIVRLLQQVRNWSTLTFRRIGGTVPLAAVIEGARQGDPRCIGELYGRFRQPLLDVLTRLAPADAEDLTQEVFLTLPAKLADYEERGSFEAWLRRVALNVYRTRRRSAERRREDTLEDYMVAEVPNELGQVTRDDLLDRALATLPDNLREAWDLHAEGYEASEVAAILGITPGAAATRLSRARDHLRGRLRELG